jgi:hypothetical protein
MQAHSWKSANSLNRYDRQLQSRPTRCTKFEQPLLPALAKKTATPCRATAGLSKYFTTTLGYSARCGRRGEKNATFPELACVLRQNGLIRRPA